MVLPLYLSDEISRQMPGRKDVKTVIIDGKKENVQKKLLVMTVMEAYKQFKQQHPDIEI